MVTHQAAAASPCMMAEARARLAAWSNRALDRLGRADAVACYGRVEQVDTMLVIASLPRCTVGDLCELIAPNTADAPVLAEVIGFDGKRTLLAPLGPTDGIASESLVRALGAPHHMRVGPHLLGAVLDGFGRVMQRGVVSPADDFSTVRVLAAAPCATRRPPIDRHIVTGVRAIDALLTLARGQRVGVFAGPGCGKSTLLGALARGIDADIVVLGLVGERGRELNEFVARELGPHKMQRTVVVCATSDAPAMARARAAFTATAIAEGFCSSGKHVLLLVDSLTRFARAQREIGLASGEPPGRLGYPPSVFSALPRLIERAGTRADGAITAVYTVLTETEHDPIADEARSLLDAHIVLSRKLAERGEFPAIDIIESLSRLMSVVVSDPHRRDAERVRTLLSRHRALEWLIALGEYEPGHDSAADEAVARHPKLAELVKQDLRTPAPWETTLEQLHDCVRDI